MKSYSLLMCYPVSTAFLSFGASGNHSIGDCVANNLQEAIQLLQVGFPHKLDERGYAKIATITYVVCESFS